MITLLAIAGLDGLLGLLLLIAIVCIVAWAVYALIQWSGIPIPRPVWIIFVALISIAALVLMFRAFSTLL